MPRIWTKPSPEPPSTGACLSSLKVESSVKSTLVRQQVLRLERSIRNLQSPSHLFGLQPHRGYRRPFHGMVRQNGFRKLGNESQGPAPASSCRMSGFSQIRKMLEIKQSMIATSKESPPLRIFRHNESPPALSAEQKEIVRLKEESNAVILCHNYQIDPIQQVADCVRFLGLGKTSRSNGCRSHRFLRSSLHGRDRQNPQSGQESSPSRP